MQVITMAKNQDASNSSRPKSFFGIKDPFRKENWVKSGLVYGAIMFGCMGIVFPCVQAQEFTFKHLILSVVIWSLAGLAFGFTMKKIFDKSKGIK